MKKLKQAAALSTAVLLAAMTGCSGAQPAATTAAETQAAEETAAEESAEAGAEEGAGEEQAAEGASDNVVTDGNGWYLWDENNQLTIEGRGADGEEAVVSAGKYEASQAGLEIIKKGGNAVDAAVAVSFALGVCEPQASGIGGGGFMTIHSEDGQDTFINFREIAPALATPEMWQKDAEGNVISNQKQKGGKSVGVPGTVRGMEYAFQNFGSGNVTWADVIQPAIDLAENGYKVSPTLYNDATNSYDAMIDYPELGKVYLREDGLNYEIGETIKNPDLAKTLKKIAEGGADAFYTGPIAEAIVKATNLYGGVMTMDDLANYQPKIMEPAKGTYRGYQIISSPLPSSGGSHVIEGLNILENFDMSSYEYDSKERLGLMTEVHKMIYNDRGKYMGDPEFVEVPIKGILSKERAAELAKLITPGESVGEYEEISPWQYEHEDTTHYSVADKKGNMVAVTQTVNYYFGSNIIPAGTGFCLNDEMDDFSADPESPNAIAGGKCPLSSMSPTVVLKEDGSPFMVLGSPGGTTIITTVEEVISNVIDYGMDMQEAINAPRFTNRATGAISYESRYEHMKDLEAIGDELTESDPYNRSFGSVQAVMYGEDGLLHGGADPRRDGKAVAY